MIIEQLQNDLQTALDHFVGLGNVLKDSYSSLYPSEQGVQIYSLLIAGRKMEKLLDEARRIQKGYVPNVTGIDLVECRGDLMKVMEYLKKSQCDTEITLKRDDMEPLQDCGMIVEGENMRMFFPPIEQSSKYQDMRRTLIEMSTCHFERLQEIINSANDIIDELVDDARQLTRNKETMAERLQAMRNVYMKESWNQDKLRMMENIEGWLLICDGDKSEALKKKHRLYVLDNTTGHGRKVLGELNGLRDDSDKLLRKLMKLHDKLTVDDMMEHYKFVESEKLLSDRIESLPLKEKCKDYQGKLFTSMAAMEFAKLMKVALNDYVGLDAKIDVAFLYYAMQDTGLVFPKVRNAKLMAEFVKDAYGIEVSEDSLTRPQRKCTGVPFCRITEKNLRGFSSNEFKKYKEKYWLCYSIINKMLDVVDDDRAEYLNGLHTTISANDVFENLCNQDRKRLYLISSVLRREI